MNPRRRVVGGREECMAGAAEEDAGMVEDKMGFEFNLRVVGPKKDLSFSLRRKIERSSADLVE